jgi:hypothetical protein
VSCSTSVWSTFAVLGQLIESAMAMIRAIVLLTASSLHVCLSVTVVLPHLISGQFPPCDRWADRPSLRELLPTPSRFVLKEEI